MALEIVESCVNCFACEPLCPSKAIVEALPHFIIERDLCTECVGDYADPQCASICPVEGAIVDEIGEPLNPIGSLTGVPPEVRAAHEPTPEIRCADFTPQGAENTRGGPSFSREISGHV